MIKAKGTQGNGRELVMLGISQQNVLALIDGRPIMVNGEALGIPCDITIFFGATNADLVRAIRPLTDGQTKMHIGLNGSGQKKGS